MQDEDPKIWGPMFWRVMRKIACQYPVANPKLSTRQAAQAFYESLTELLPCSTCRSNYTDLLDRFPIEDNLDSCASLQNWVETIRTEVDKHAKKPSSASSIPAQNYPSAPLAHITQAVPTERMRQMQARHQYYQQKIARQKGVVQPNTNATRTLKAAPVHAIPRHSIRPVVVKEPPARPTARGIYTPSLNKRDCGCGKK